MTRDDVIAEARKWIGTPYRHQGRTKHGVDCIGLLILVADALGVPYEDRTDYPRDPLNITLLNHLRQYLTFVRPEENHLGCVGIFRQVRLPCHVGIIASKNGFETVIHARANVRTVIEEKFDRGFQGMMLVEAGAFPGLEA